MDQFTYAERATDWRGNNNIAESIFEQLALERHPVPAWVVVGAGTGGTSATIGRFVRYRRHHTRICVVDPENSAFFEGWATRDPAHVTGGGSRIEGIGRPRVEPSFVPAVVDAMMEVPDAASIAAMRWCSRVTGRLVGGSTGTAMWGALRLVAEMRAAGAGRQRGHAALRRRRALRLDLLRRRLAGRRRAWTSRRTPDPGAVRRHRRLARTRRTGARARQARCQSNVSGPVGTCQPSRPASVRDGHGRCPCDHPPPRPAEPRRHRALRGDPPLDVEALADGTSPRPAGRRAPRRGPAARAVGGLRAALPRLRGRATHDWEWDPDLLGSGARSRRASRPGCAS